MILFQHMSIGQINAPQLLERPVIRNGYYQVLFRDPFGLYKYFPKICNMLQYFYHNNRIKSLILKRKLPLNKKSLNTALLCYFDVIFIGIGPVTLKIRLCKFKAVASRRTAQIQDLFS